MSELDIHGVPYSEVRRRMMNKVEKLDNGCWFFTGAKKPTGYGNMTVGGIVINTHKLSYLIHVGPIKDGLCVLHKCDNPSCVNPDHFFLGTKKDNMIDCSKKGRVYKGGANNPRRGSDSGVSKLTEKDVVEILKDGRSTYKIAESCGVTQGTVWQIKARKTWLHVDID